MQVLGLLKTKDREIAVLQKTASDMKSHIDELNANLDEQKE